MTDTVPAEVLKAIERFRDANHQLGTAAATYPPNAAGRRSISNHCEHCNLTYDSLVAAIAKALDAARREGEPLPKRVDREWNEQCPTRSVNLEEAMTAGRTGGMTMQTPEEFAGVLCEAAKGVGWKSRMADMIAARDAEKREHEFEADLIYYVGEETARILLKSIRASAPAGKAAGEPVKDRNYWPGNVL